MAKTTVACIITAEKICYACNLPETLSLAPGTQCLVKLSYGVDVGILHQMPTPPTACASRSEQNILRAVDARDTKTLQARTKAAAKALQDFSKSIAWEKDTVKVVHTRISFGGERLFIRYAADKNVDLRRFTNQLQRDFQTTVDIEQVGVRDQAAFTGGLGVCGQTVCCHRWLSQLPLVNIRMAKDQELALNPVTLNGTCGRLKCCLQYEHEQYHEIGKWLPETGQKVRCCKTQQLIGTVVGRDILRERLLVKTKDGLLETFGAATLRAIQAPRNTTPGEKT